MILRLGQRIKCVKYWDKRRRAWHTLPQWVLHPSEAYFLHDWLNGKMTYYGTSVPVQVIYHTSPESYTDKLRTLWEAQPV